jgi:hypothetical protein
MEWAKSQFSKAEIDAAGRTLANRKSLVDELSRAFTVINNWRAAHGFPLNTFQCTLRVKARQVDPLQAVVAQRLKRMSSIYAKLSRMTRLSLSEMQDIGGCRAIVGTVEQTRLLVELYKKGHIKHELDHEDDYITKPKSSGYRGVHLIYRYYSDKKDTYNGQKIELQLRSRFQHAWATAVETVGVLTDQALKISWGKKDWLRFFALMATDLALREKTEPVPDTPTDKRQLRAELKEYARQLDVEGRLRTFAVALHETEEGVANATYFLLRLNPKTQELTVRGYTLRERAQASADYLETEKEIRKSGADAVLVSAESLDALRRAYPNYFLDTHLFAEMVSRATQ